MTFRVSVCASILTAIFLSTGATGAAQDAQEIQSMDAGAAALRRGDAKEAEESFRRALQANPASADAYLGIGLAELRENLLEDAVRSLSKASELNPSLPSAHMFDGIALFQMNSFDEAADQLRQEIKLQPKSTEALTWLGIIELQAGHPKQAAVPFDQAGTLSPASPSVLYYQVRAHTLAAQEAFRALAAIDGDSAYVHRAQAEIYSESHQPDKAIDEYQAAIKKAPRDPELYEALGDEEQRVSHTAEAVKAYQAELALNPDSSIALYNLGKIQVETADAAQGVALLQRAAEAHAAAAPTLFYLGFGLAKLGKYEEAAKSLEQSLASSPSEMIRQRDLYELVRVYQRLDRKADLQRALDSLKSLKNK
ncbi:tetratricopeptide repeat protein [Granulicella aggregans]|uniref:tetratricopeptide repeat protein n=1 Tax=Granulicella aggregans TaxID=474949 RepID=UPI0021DFAF55|nr:tetratricopeptide repeat protein [Granulicella aggregans]